MAKYEDSAYAIKEIQSWSAEKIAKELRSLPRATLGPDAYYLLFAEALARLLSRP